MINKIFKNKKLKYINLSKNLITTRLLMPDAMFKVCIFGDGGVGKTCLVNRYLTGVFKSGSVMTIGVDFLMKKLEIQGKKVVLQIWDFAGEKRFKFILSSYARGASGGIFMFDITRMSSLRNLTSWLEVFKEGANEKEENTPIIMVGGKLDLHDRRSVNIKDAIELARSHNLFEYIECSSKTGENVESIFYNLTHLLTERAGVI